MREAFRLPEVLPCGCKLTNGRGSRILTHAITLKDGTRICRCGRRWKFRLEIEEFKELGLYVKP